MIYSIHRHTFSPGQPYRYDVTDPTGNALYCIERNDPCFTFNEQSISILDTNGAEVATIEQAHDERRPASRTYWINFPDAAVPRFGIEQTHSAADQALRRSPHFRLIGVAPEYVARGSAHGAHFYEIFDADDQLQGEITPQWRGAAYTIESDSPVLAQLPLLLSALAVVIDLHHDDD